MPFPIATASRKSRLAALLEHFSQVEDPRDVRELIFDTNLARRIQHEINT